MYTWTEKYEGEPRSKYSYTRTEKANEITKGKDLHMDREKPMKVPRKRFTHGQGKANESTKGKDLHMDRETPMR